MLCFPQLSTGALAQYPLRRRRYARSVVNEAPGGKRTTWRDEGAGWLEWELDLGGLTASEWQAVDGLFDACRGRAGEFTFLDPAENLVGWSEDLAAAAWTLGAGLQLSPGQPDPLGTARATRLVNGSQAAARLTETLGAPSWFLYCLSARVRSAGPSAVKLVLAGGGREESRTVEAGPAWREAWFSARCGDLGETITCGIELAPGAAVDVFGIQLEPQAGPSAYRATAGQGGVHPAARFAEDTLRSTAEGVDRYRTLVRIRSLRGDV